MKKLLLILLLSLSILITSCTFNAEIDDKQTPEQTNSPEPTSTITPEPSSTTTPEPTSTSTFEPTSTPTAEPTLTPIQIQLSEVYLEDIVIKDGDLPAGFSGAQIRDTAPEMFSGVPKAQNTYYQQFEKGGEAQGGVTIFLFDSQKDIELAYNTINKGFSDKAEKLDDVGEKANIIYVSTELFGSKFQFGDVLFTRCYAVVHIRMTDVTGEDSLIAYAKRLDRRLSDLVCP